MTPQTIKHPQGSLTIGVDSTEARRATPIVVTVKAGVFLQYPLHLTVEQASDIAGALAVAIDEARTDEARRYVRDLPL